MTAAKPTPATPASAAPARAQEAPRFRRPLRLGTRRSKLALAQSERVAESVRRLTGRAVELVEITTYGDVSRQHLSEIGGQGVFVAALREAVGLGEVDLAVHSMKDLPTAQPDELVIAAVPPREDPRDVLVARDGRSFEQLLAAGGRPRVGTGSARRACQLHVWARSLGGAIETVPVRGNVDTRIGYVHEGRLDAVALAAAGLSRLGRLGEATELIPLDAVLPAPGQGALAVECASSSAHLAAQLAQLDDPQTRVAVTAERTLLAALEAGCSAPVGALADLHAEGPSGADKGTASTATEMRLRGVVGTPDGSALVQLSATGPVPASHDDAVALGSELAEELLAKGAAGLMGERAL